MATLFSQRVWELATSIPEGQVTTYGILAKCATALHDADVPTYSASQPLRGVDVRFVVDEEDYETAVRALHDSVIDRRKLATIAA